jgi:hypothetical protein
MAPPFRQPLGGEENAIANYSQKDCLNIPFVSTVVASHSQ